MLLVRVIAVLMTVAISQATAPAAPTTKPNHTANSKSVAAVDSAIRALGREWATAQSGGKQKLRQTCSYFTENRSDDVTIDAIFGALERGAHDDSPQAYYMRWQLLSGFDG